MQLTIQRFLCIVIAPCVHSRFNCMKIYALALLAISGTAGAQVGKSSLDHSSTVVSSCTISTAQHMLFGDFNPLSVSTKSATGTVRVLCSKGTYSLRRNLGGNASNFNKTFKYGNSNGTSSGNYTDVTLTCMNTIRSAGGQIIEYRIGTRPTVTATFTGSGRDTQADNRNCSSSDLVTHQSLTFTQNREQLINIIATIGGSQDSTAYKTLKKGVYTDNLTLSVVF